MKVKDFIKCIRPITTLDPESELKIIYSADEFVFSHLVIDACEVTICLVDSIIP